MTESGSIKKKRKLKNKFKKFKINAKVFQTPSDIYNK